MQSRLALEWTSVIIVIVNWIWTHLGDITFGLSVRWFSEFNRRGTL